MLGSMSRSRVAARLPCIWLIAIGALVACDTSSPSEARAPGTVAMARRLQQLADSIDPLEEPELNLERLRAFTASDPPSDPAALMLRQGLIAQEVLHIGRSGPAVEQFMLMHDQLEQADAEPVPGFLDTLDELVGVGLLRQGLAQECPAAQGDPSFPCWFEIPPHEAPSLGDSARITLERAVRWTLAAAADRPDDLRARWMVNLVAMAAGLWPDSVPAGLLIPPAAFADDDTIPRFEDVAADVGLDVISVSGAGIVDDFTGDGLPDVMVSSRGLHDPLRYFENDGDGAFQERTIAAGLGGLVGGLNLVHADYDNDGDIDVLVLRGGWMTLGFPNSLLRNEGDGTFADVTRAAGLYSEHPTQTAAWADYDGDGWLDLFVGNESRDGEAHGSELYRSRGDGSFERVSSEAGIDVHAFVKGVAWGDYDNDGRPDLYLSILRGPNRLLRNAGPAASGGWMFTDVTEQAGVAEPINSFPTWFFDYDNDGWLDLFAAGYQAQTADVAGEALGLAHGGELPRLYRNRGDGTFADVTEAAGLDRVLYAMGSNYGDLDNDGWLDLFVGTGDPDFRQLMPNRMFRNIEGRFAEVTASGGFGRLDKGHGVSFVDVDDDGDQDIHMVLGGAHQGDLSRNVLYENPGFGNDWVTLELVGEAANRSGLGARITLEIDGADGPRTIHRHAGTGGSFGANPLRQEIGLGRAARIRSVEIDWPGSGTIDSLGPLEANRFYRVREGRGAAEPIERPRVRLRHRP